MTIKLIGLTSFQETLAAKENFMSVRSELSYNIGCQAQKTSTDADPKKRKEEDQHKCQVSFLQFDLLKTA